MDVLRFFQAALKDRPDAREDGYSRERYYLEREREAVLRTLRRMAGDGAWDLDTLADWFAPMSASRHADPVGYNATVHTMLARLRMVEAGWPLYVLDGRLAEAFLRTPLPWRYIPRDAWPLLRLPHAGMYLRLPRGLFTIHDSLTGDHGAEGIWICRAGNDSILVAAQGEAHGYYHGIVNDTVASRVYYVGRDVEDGPHGLAEGARVALNFLLALNTRHVAERRVHVETPRSAKKRRAAAKRGKPVHSHVYVTLTPRAIRQVPRRRGAQDARKWTLTRKVAVAGHWRSYWITEARARENGERVLERRVNAHGTKLCRVLRWIYPHTRGPDGDAVAPTYIVR